MRKIVILILVLLIALFASIIVVDERQSAVINSYTGKQRVESAGIYFTRPFWDNVVYVFTNERTALLSLAVNESEAASNKPLQIEVLVSYHVINPAIYLAAKQKSGKYGISEKIAGILITSIKSKIAASTLDKLNQEALLPFDSSKFKDLGISVDQVSLLNIKFIDTLKQR